MVQIKGIIKSSYYSIPQKFIMYFIHEAEYKIKIKNKSDSDKLKYFFECFKFLSDVKDVDLEKSNFFTDADSGNSYDSDDSD